VKLERLFFVILATAASLAAASNLTSGMQSGKADLKSAGPLAFGPEGILFVGDPIGAQVIAFDTGDAKAGKGGDVDLAGLQDKIAAHLGSSADQILVNDMAVNPASKAIYLSVQRGRGPEATPVILRLRDGKLEDLKLDAIRHAAASIPNAPAADAKDQRGNSKRTEAITDLAYLEGKVVIAGLSNEEFASTLRTIDFPFSKGAGTTNVEIFHGAHGRYETNAPVRTFTSYNIGSKPHILAAYTCTPLVRIPMSDLKAGSKIMGTTIAELGNRNRPLDMIVYQKGAADFILMNNSSRGVMKMPAANLDGYQAITKPTDITGVPYETIAAWKGVEQLDRYDNLHALLLVRTEAGGLDLKKVALP
jgi:hypothetical protein